MFVADILKVLYAPHKVFKQITQNPKYWGPILVLIIFVAAQTAVFFAQYSKTYYEETNPRIGQLTAWTESPTLWTSTALVSSNTDDFFNSTFYGNSSLQFSKSNSSNLAMTLTNLNGSVNCGPSGFQELYTQIKLIEPSTAPSGANLKLFSLDPSNYFDLDLTSEFSSLTSETWNNYTIPVGPNSADWQNIGNPSWNNITEISFELSFPESADITLRVGGLFFRGLYRTPIEAFGVAEFASSAAFSAVFSFVVQWLALSVIFYLIIKLFRGAVTWKPLFVSIGFALTLMVVESLIILASTASLPAQIHYPFEFAFSYQLSYPAQFVEMFSAASQATYNSMIAPQISTYSSIVAFVVIAVYVWLAAVGSTVVHAITEFPWTKSILTSAASIVATYVLLSLLTALGII